jgi:hypothetical protein
MEDERDGVEPTGVMGVGDVFFGGADIIARSIALATPKRRTGITK